MKIVCDGDGRANSGIFGTAARGSTALITRAYSGCSSSGSPGQTLLSVAGFPGLANKQAQASGTEGSDRRPAFPTSEYTKSPLNCECCDPFLSDALVEAPETNNTSTGSHNVIGRSQRPSSQRSCLEQLNREQPNNRSSDCVQTVLFESENTALGNSSRGTINVPGNQHGDRTRRPQELSETTKQSFKQQHNIYSESTKPKTSSQQSENIKRRAMTPELNLMLQWQDTTTVPEDQSKKREQELSGTKKRNLLTPRPQLRVMETATRIRSCIKNKLALMQKEPQSNNPQCDESLKCSYCQKQFKSKASRNRHVRNIHTNPEESKAQCPMCSCVLVHARNLPSHIQSHYGKSVHECQCGKAYTYKRSLIRHQLLGKCSKATEPTVSKNTMGHFCEKCGVLLFSARSLRMHVATIHAEGRFKCPVPKCDTTYKKRKHLSMHLRNIHGYGDDVVRAVIKATVS